MNFADLSSSDWTAVGTIALAVMTLAAVITTIVITAQDRRHAETRLQEEQRHEEERDQFARAYAVDFMSKQVFGAQAGVSSAESTATVHAAMVTNGSDRPIWNVVCKIETDHPSFPAVPLDKKLAARVGEFVDYALGSAARAEQFMPFTNGNTHRIKVLRSGHRGAFIWPFGVKEYLNPHFWVRFTDDHDKHWEMGPDLHLSRIQNREDW